MTGRLDLTPWARAAIPEAEREALRQRVPAGHSLTVSTSDRRLYTVRLTTPQHGLVAQAFGTLESALDRVLDKPRCNACGKRLTDGDCDSCTADREAAS